MKLKRVRLGVPFDVRNPPELDITSTTYLTVVDVETHQENDTSKVLLTGLIFEDPTVTINRKLMGQVSRTISMSYVAVSKLPAN